MMGGLEKGKSKTLNTLIVYAKYEIICLLDADDMWLETKLEKQLPYMEKYDVVGTNTVYFGERSDEPVIFLGKLYKDMFIFQNPLINSSIMLKKADGFWDENYEPTNDYDLSVRLIIKNKTFYNIPEILTKHRIYSTSEFSNRFDEYRAKILERLPKLSQGKLIGLGGVLKGKRWML
jgi:teichuronic acid biosynthesis glycosyltransferase TuaG